MDKVIKKELEDVHQEHEKLQGAVKDQDEKKETLMKETKQLKEMVQRKTILIASNLIIDTYW